MTGASALSPAAAALTAATTGAAYSCFADRFTGRLKKGLRADFVVVDMEWAADRLLQARVEETWFDGRAVFADGIEMRGPV